MILLLQCHGSSNLIYIERIWILLALQFPKTIYLLVWLHHYAGCYSMPHARMNMDLKGSL